jgi:CubicO group peptidase (beta-lactamase class C family)
MGMLTSADPFRYILAKPLAASPGTTYLYSNGDASLLGAALVKGTGRAWSDYARDKLFTPLDIVDFEWDAVGRSRKLGTYGSLRLRPRDMVKLGQLLLTDGVWNDRRVLPSAWAAQSIMPRLNGEGLFFYGYQWWLGRSFVNGRDLHWAAGFGIGGQRLYIVPALDLVVGLSLGQYGGRLQGVIPSAILNSIVLPSVKGESR